MDALSEGFLSIFFRHHRQRELSIVFDPDFISQELLQTVFPNATFLAPEVQKVAALPGRGESSTITTHDSAPSSEIFFKRNISLKDFNGCGWAERLEEGEGESEGWIVHRWSMGIFCLRKGSASASAFLPRVPITLITPSIRPEKIQRIYEDLLPYWDYFAGWRIVYDGKKIKDGFQQLEGAEKVVESVVRDAMSVAGNAQRNYALGELAKEGYQGDVYYLDDDNLIHPNLYLIFHLAEPGFLYTFNSGHLKGNQAIMGRIDTAMCLVPFPLCRRIRWNVSEYMADGRYIATCCSMFPKRWVYLKVQGAGYNQLR